MDLNPIVLSIPVFFVLIGAELLYDWRKNKGERLYRWNDSFTNISCGIIDQVTGVFAKLFTVTAYAAVFALVAPLRIWEFPVTGLTFALTFVVGDFFYYWSHRISHQVTVFWTGHVVHHQSEEYNLSVALRQGAFHKILMFWIYLPMAALGFPVEWFVLAMAFNLLYQFWIHTEIIPKLGVFEWLFNTPSHHRVHHGRNPKYIDRNHGGVFIIWDRLFGTFQAEEETPTYGITQPTETFNPVWAHLQPYARLYHELKGIPNRTDKVRFLFKSPGWYPASMGGPLVVPEPTESPTFDWALPRALNVYLFGQYVVLIAATSVFLFGLAKLPNWSKVLFVVIILWTLAGLGGLFDRSTWGFRLEWCRIAVLAGIACYLPFVGTATWITVLLATLALASACWFGAIQKRLHT